MILLPPVSSSGSHFLTSSSRLSFPWSRSWRMATAVNCLASDPIGSIVPMVIGALPSTSALPYASSSNLSLPLNAAATIPTDRLSRGRHWTRPPEW